MTITYPLLNQLMPGCKIAKYSTQYVPRHKGNILIEALGPILEDSDAEKILMAGTMGAEAAPCKSEHLSMGINTRLALVDGIRDFYFPLRRNLDLVSDIDRMMRDGYQGRIPNSVSHYEVFASIEELSKVNAVEKLTKLAMNDLIAKQICNVLLAHPGAGKTVTVQRIAKAYESPIYHPSVGIYQIPCILVENFTDGPAGMLKAIITAIDAKLPAFRHEATYLGKSRKPTIFELIIIVARLCTIHCVGIIIIDEIQKLEQRNVSHQTMLNQILTVCNVAKVPILFTGTNRVAYDFWNDGPLGRRSCGIPPWQRLAIYGGNSELESFLRLLLRDYQWLPTPIDYSDDLGVHLFNLTQGILSAIVEVYIFAQHIAIKQNASQLAFYHFTQAYNEHMGGIHEVIEALRSGTISAISEEADYMPITIEEIESAYRNNVSIAYPTSRKSKNTPSVEAAVQVATAVHAAGFPANEAVEKAKRVLASIPDATPAEAVLEALKKPRKAKGTIRTYEDRPDDYRRDYYLASLEGITVKSQLIKSGKLKPLLDMLEL